MTKADERKAASKARRERMRNAQEESISVVPHVHEGMSCGRCGAEDCIIVPNVAPDFKSLQGVGLTQHAMLCPEVCAGPWWCGLCNCFMSMPGSEGKYTEHSRDCNTAHPEVRAAWESKNDHAMMKLAAMVAARGEFLPAFLMNMLFPGFEHADPPSFAAFKATAEVTP